MRVRVADIAGGGIGLDGVELNDPNNHPATPPIIYRRHEPIQPPRLNPIPPPQLPTDIVTFTVGAALDRLVVRSGKDVTPDPDYPLPEIRALDAPTASLQLIEQHGLFDDKDLTDAQAFQWAQRAMRADGTRRRPDRAARRVRHCAQQGRLQRALQRDIHRGHQGPGTLHTGSTGRIDISATWQEFDDTGPQTTGARTVTVDHLDGRDIALSDPPPQPGFSTNFQLRHEFGDTKHRQVTYTLNATSRFRPYFKPDEPDESFHASLAQPPVNIPSTARPPAAVVLGVVPAFAWQRTQPTPDRIERIRGGQRLRVELARPWFVTGEGEQLAVVLGNGADLVTRIGRDPLFASPATPPHPTPDWFPNTVSATVILPELADDVTVVPFDVTAGGDRWLADITFALPDSAQSYNPFVSLALARYQPDTVNGLAPLSPVVVAEQVPLLPDRHVVITRTGDQLSLTVDGTSPTPPNQFEAILETCDPGVDPASVDLIVDDPAGQPGVIAWRPVLGQSVTRGDDGTIPPLTLPATPGPLRLRLRETENLPLRPGTDTTPDDLVRRTVFVDTIVLPDTWRPA